MLTSSLPVICADDAGHLGNCVNSHLAGDTFEITTDGLEVCATRTDSGESWGMHLEIVCVSTGEAPTPEENPDDVTAVAGPPAAVLIDDSTENTTGSMDMTIAVMVQMRHSAQVPFHCSWSLPVAAPSLSRLSTSTGAFHDREYAFGSLGYFTGKTFIKYSNDDKLTESPRLDKNQDSRAIDRAHCEVGKSWFVFVDWPRFHTVSSCRSVFPWPARHQQE